MIIRKILPLLLLVFIMGSCSNDDDNIDIDTIGQTFEVSNIDFVSADGLEAIVNVVVPNNIPVFDSDVPLVFVLDPVASAANGLDVFEPLPRVFFFDDGGFAQYRFNFIFDSTSGIFDLDIVLESDFFDGLGDAFTQNQIFRIVIVPSEFAQTNETENLADVLAQLNLD
jgi:hypothetical protein